MKFPGEAAERVASVLLTRGAASVAELASELHLTPQAIRRSLSSLEATGMVQSHERAPFGPAPAKRRGRPSSSYSLTAMGRNAFDQSYDDLALESLQFIERNFGRENVRAFASERANRILTGKTVPEIVASLNAAGFEATFESANTSGQNTSGQLCQHHCPVIDAARAYPELCEEETRVLGGRLEVIPLDSRLWLKAMPSVRR